MNTDKKELTTHMGSVGAESGQSIQNYNNSSITTNFSKSNDEFSGTDLPLDVRLRMIQRAAEPGFLRTVTMPELYDVAFHSRPPVIDGLLCTGLFILAGAPKVGKSFLVAQIAFHVSSGTPLWNYTVRKGTVLYMALEDDYQRLQERMYRMFNEQESVNLHFSVTAKMLGDGLEDQINTFVRDHKDTKLIIIDTLQKVRKVTTDGYSYASDYEVVGKLKQLADQNQICIILVHHTRKQQSGDRFEMISGTNGILGAADGALVLQKEKRTDTEATLDITSRDQRDQRLHLIRDHDSLTWKLDHAENEPDTLPYDELLCKTAAVLSPKSPEWSGTATELAEIIGADMHPNMLAKHLNVNASRLFNEFHILYDNSRNHAGRRISMKLITAEA